MNRTPRRILIGTRIDPEIYEAVLAAAELPADVTASQLGRYAFAVAAGLPHQAARQIAYGIPPQTAVVLTASVTAAG
jgi:hypothetical protein